MMTAREIADTLAEITGNRPTVLPLLTTSTSTTQRPQDMRATKDRPGTFDSHERRIAVAPVRATAQRITTSFALIGRQLDLLRGRMDTEARRAEVDECLEDLAVARNAVAKLEKTLESLSLARGKAA